MRSIILAEARQLGQRGATWTLLGIWTVMFAMFAYVIPIIDRSEGASLDELLPVHFASNALTIFPFFGGVLVLILAVMAIGGDYGRGLTGPLLTQRAGRLEVFGGKIAALLLWLVPFVALAFATSLAASLVYALVDSGSSELPDGWLMAKSLLAGWLILAVWTMLGVLLATLSRGTSLAIGVSILYGLVFEGLLSNLFDGVAVLKPLIQGFIRTNAYSLVQPLGVFAEQTRDIGPGAFAGPYVSGVQALVMLTLYLLAFAAIAGAVFKRRDVA